MKRVIMYKYYNPDRLFGGYGWSIKKVWDDWNHIYSDPYYVEIPNDFFLEETVTGEEMYFKKGYNFAYTLATNNRHCEKCIPFLIGGNPVESIKLKVIGIVPKDIR